MSRPAPAPQPDLPSRLLAAIAERDAAIAARLGQKWVHRRGLEALDSFLLTAVAPSQGLEAAQWLRGQLGLVEAVATAPLVIEERAPDPERAIESQLDPGPSAQESHQQPLFGRMKALLRQCLSEVEQVVVVGPRGDRAEPVMTEALSETPVQSVAPGPQAARPELVLPLQAAATPAPAPAALAALRAWLPDADDDGRDLSRAS